jgi:hypothetical protein
MKKTLSFALLGAASLALAACGSSNSADEQATPDNVEMPAEETMSTVAAVPVPDKGATEAADPNAGAKANDAAAAAAAAAADFNAAGDGEAAKSAEEKAIDQAEKKM